MVYALLLLLSVVFFELFLILKIGASAKAIIGSSQDAMRALASRDLTDDEKESLMRRGSVAVLKTTLGLAGKLLLTGGVLVALFELILRMFPELRPALLASLVSPIVIAILTVAVVGYAFVRSKISRRQVSL